MPAFQYLDVDDVIAIFKEAIGVPVVRNADGLASAVARPQQSAFLGDAYETITLKAAALMQSLAQNQPFLDGNKRIAWICGKLFLQLHGLTMNASDREAHQLFTEQIAKDMTIAELAQWVERHTEVFSP